jgi:hypothetical protein
MDLNTKTTRRKVWDVRHYGASMQRLVDCQCVLKSTTNPCKDHWHTVVYFQKPCTAEDVEKHWQDQELEHVTVDNRLPVQCRSEYQYRKLVTCRKHVPLYAQQLYD